MKKVKSFLQYNGIEGIFASINLLDDDINSFIENNGKNLVDVTNVHIAPSFSFSKPDYIIRTIVYEE